MSKSSTKVVPVQANHVTLLYGDTGSGKTLLAATMARAYERVLILNSDRNLNSVAHVPGLVELPVTTVDDILSVVNELALSDPGKRRPELRDVDVVVVDSLSALRDNLLVDIVKHNMELSQQKVSRGGKGVARTEFYPTQQDYGHLTFTLGAIIQVLKRLGLPVVLTAGLAVEIDPDSGMTIGAFPNLNPAIRSATSYMANNIWFTDVKAAKHRIRVLPDPSMPHIIKTGNPRFVAALKADTRERAIQAGAKDATAAEGWYKPVLDADYLPTPGLDTLLDLFDKSIGAKNG